MHHLLNAVTAARLAVLLTAATLLLVCLQLVQAPTGSGALVGPPRLELADAGALGGRVPAPRAAPAPLALPGVVLRQRQHPQQAASEPPRPPSRHQHDRDAGRRSATGHGTSHVRGGHGRHTQGRQAHGRHPHRRHAHGRHPHRRHAHGKHPHRRHGHKVHRGQGRHPGQAGRPTADRSAARPGIVSGGRDISWPQCARHLGIPDLKGVGLPLPEPGVRFVVVGLTNGRSFTPNPCLARHLRWVRGHHVFASAYAFTTYPTDRQLRKFGKRGPFSTRTVYGRLRNAGYASAAYNIRLLRRHHFRTPHVWLDVEASSSRPWSRHVAFNRAVVKGWLAAYRRAGYGVGFYSTEHIWSQILGRTRFGLPEWRTAGPDTARAALRRCSESSFQGGAAVLAQWWSSRRDFDRMCPGHHGGGQMRKYFHKY